MSTRFYPVYQRGNPQLRVFLPNFWMKLIAPKRKQPPNIVTFCCSMQMTEHDVKNYLEKIYNIDIVEVRTKIATGKFVRERLRNCIIKEDDKKFAYVVLPKTQSFEFPNMFQEVTDELEKESVNMAKKDIEDFLEPNKAPGLPGWFRI
ncbi:PREDICTED: probable 39S ribosomal protein L23, mitochondrial [Vollenhovia emeryi]|uniref:probable 39S ribosomal protein L23, mitochondrial n=1 Tax=Vollenhovia emeryi TaxID=411798 RepID=UPI0005F36EDC|nr:PREDICTED: probable 39S ribosomal protein L23, mitochondrial [Vollenhovia emeryi]